MTQFDHCPRCGGANYKLFASVDVYECRKCGVVFCISGKCGGRCRKLRFKE